MFLCAHVIVVLLSFHFSCMFLMYCSSQECSNSWGSCFWRSDKYSICVPVGLELLAGEVFGQELNCRALQLFSSFFADCKNNFCLFLKASETIDRDVRFITENDWERARRFWMHAPPKFGVGASWFGRDFKEAGTRYEITGSSYHQKLIFLPLP